MELSGKFSHSLDFIMFSIIASTSPPFVFLVVSSLLYQSRYNISAGLILLRQSDERRTHITPEAGLLWMGWERYTWLCRAEHCLLYRRSII